MGHAICVVDGRPNEACSLWSCLLLVADAGHRCDALRPANGFRLANRFRPPNGCGSRSSWDLRVSGALTLLFNGMIDHRRAVETRRCGSRRTGGWAHLLGTGRGDGETAAVAQGFTGVQREDAGNVAEGRHAETRPDELGHGPEEVAKEAADGDEIPARLAWLGLHEISRLCVLPSARAPCHPFNVRAPSVGRARARARQRSPASTATSQ
jgi:hypothetical protein